MNWISYSERKPSPEPKRQVLFKAIDGYYYTPFTTQGVGGLTSVTDWAEIEPPHVMGIPITETTPNPFEKWWNINFAHSVTKSTAKMIWDAAINHMKERQ